MRKNSIKNTRINSEVQKELSVLILQEIKDPRISKMTTITSVEVAPDLKTAKVYVSVLGTPEETEDTIKGLKSAAPFLRGQLAKTINLRNTPELIFKVDESIEYGINMSKMIDELVAKEHLDDDTDDIDDDEEFDEDEDFEDEESDDSEEDL
ncbi:MAG: 30S ribosome-binding factor RbfA [Lachnospiraceae bacterium]|nr:30S ribosome-binding factor RbfA [Lachnospiraceae bacterium]